MNDSFTLISGSVPIVPKGEPGAAKVGTDSLPLKLPPNRVAPSPSPAPALKRAAWLGLLKRVGLFVLTGFGLAGAAFALPWLGPLGLAGVVASGSTMVLAVMDMVTAIANVVHVYRKGSELKGGDDALVNLVLWVNHRFGGTLEREQIELGSSCLRIVLNVISGVIGCLGVNAMAHAGVTFREIEHFGPVIVSAASSLLMTLQMVFASRARQMHSANPVKLTGFKDLKPA